MIVPTTTTTKGVDTIKKHKICVAEGQDIRALVYEPLIEFKPTVGGPNALHFRFIVIS